MVADGRLPGATILAGARWRLNTLKLGRRNSAHQLVCGSNPVELYGWGYKDEDSPFAQDTSRSGGFAQHWKLRMVAQEAALQEVARSKLRRLSARNKSFNWPDVSLGDSVLYYKAVYRKSAP